jgi:K+-transporting ATPase ATPase C chain
MFIKNLRASIVTIVLFTFLTGVLYPLLVTGVAQLFFPGKANGSILKKDGKIVGSDLIGQPFSNPAYFWSRPSATSPVPYNGGLSTGSNYGPLNASFLDGVRMRIRDLRDADPENNLPVPVDLVTSSASGLDPHISIAAALYQVGRVARARGMTVDQVRAYVALNTERRALGFLGEPRVHVLKLNLALDENQLQLESKR